MSWILARGADFPAGTPLDRVFGLRPNLYEDFRRFYALFWERGLLDPVLLELCRLRVAQLHGCRSELAVRYQPALDAGLAEEKIQAMCKGTRSPLFDDAERACIAFAELFVADPHAVTDADAAAVVAALGDEGAVALVQALAIFDGFARFRILLDVAPPGEPPLPVPAPSRGSASLY